MGEAKRRFELADQHRPGAPRGRRVAFAFRTLQLDLGHFDIPVAILVPDEFIESARGEVEAVIVDVLGDVLLGLLQATEKPAIHETQRTRL